MTREEVCNILDETPRDELGDMLIDLMVQHWMTDEGVSEAELLALIRTVIEENQ